MAGATPAPDPGSTFAPNPHPLMGADSTPTEVPPPPQPKPPAQPKQPKQNQQDTDTFSPLPANHPSARPKPPDNYIERLNGLSSAHPWMPLQTRAMLAVNPATDKAVADMANALRKTYASVGGAVAYVTDDPVLQKDPSLALSLKSYLNGVIGPSPVADSDLVHVQKQLQAQGFGKGLAADGTWNNEWQSTFTNWSSNLKAQQLGGSQAGSITVGQGLSALNQILPVESATSIGAFISHIPLGIANDLHTAAGAVSGGADALYQGFQPHNLLNPNFTPNRNTQAGVEAAAENASTAGLGPHVTPQTAFSKQGLRTQTMDVIQVAGDLLATHGLLKAGGAVSDAARATDWKSLDASAAQRGPGTIAKQTFGRVGKGYTETDGAPLLSKAAAQNVRITRMAGPVTDAIAGSNGYYYRARTLLAAPYAVPGVKVAGTAVGQFGLAGAKIRAIGTAESLIGGQTSPLSQAIDHFKTVNQFNDQVQSRLQGTAFGHHFDVGLNSLAVLLHPDLETGAAGTVSRTVGHDVTGVNQASQHIFGPDTGFGLSIERGVNWTKDGDQRQSYDDMVKQAGGQNNFTQFWSSKIMQHAAVHAAERDYRAMSPEEQQELGTTEGTFNDQNVAIKTLANKYMASAIEGGDWTKLNQAAHEIISDDNPSQGQWGGHNSLAKRIAAEIERSGVSPSKWLSENVAGHAAGSKIMRDTVVPRLNELVADDTPTGSVGMARADYLTSDQAHNDINDLEANYNAAAQAVQDVKTGKYAAPAGAQATEAEAALAKAGEDLEKHNKRDVTDDYPISQKVEESRPLSKAYREAVARVDAERGEAKQTQGINLLDNLHDAQHAIRQYLVDNFGIDGFGMPQDDNDMIKLLREKADGQASKVFVRKTPLRVEPQDPSVGLLPGSDQLGEHSLERSIRGSAFTNVSPTEAMNLIHENDNEHDLYPWTNDRKLAISPAEGNKGVTIEHEPSALYGARDRSAGEGFEDTGGSAHFDAARNNTRGLNDIRTVEFHPVASESTKEATARTLLQDQLDDAGFIKFNHSNGVTKYVRPGLVGGTVPTSPQLIKAIGQLKELGYQPVMGKGIGFDFYKSPLFDVADSRLSTSRRYLENLGLSPENIPSTDIGFTWRLKFERNLQQMVEKYYGRIAKDGEDSSPERGELKLYPTHMVKTIIGMMTDRDALPESGGILSAVQHSVGSKAYEADKKLRVEDLMGKGMSEKDATIQVENRMRQELENPLGMVHLTKRDIRSALNHRPPSPEQDDARTFQMASEAEYQGTKTGIEGQPYYDEKAVQAVYDAIQHTNAQMPARLVGWQKAEAVGALALSYAGRPIPGSLGRGLEYLPTRLVTLRNKARFSLSPQFALRRVVKVNAKMELDGIPGTFTPMRQLMLAGKGATEAEGKANWKAAMARLDRIVPEGANSEYDEGTQALYARDPWGLYNHRNYEAYYAQEMAKKGATDTEIRDGLIKNFSYGSKAFGEGRSALERSANFVFFPLSFDKTLYRNFGAYMLDHTAQRIILQAGLEAYNRYNMSDPNGTKLMSSNWWLNHAPVIKQALELNAFAHGIGLGQFGGINAPLLNLFLPQSYESTSKGLSTLKAILPVITTAGNLFSQTGQTLQVGRQLIADQFASNNPTIQGFTGAKQTTAEALQGIFYAKPVAEVPIAQETQAYQYRRQLKALFANEIDYNAHHTQKYTLGKDTAVFGDWSGETINATLIDHLVHQKFPAFPEDGPQLYYDQGQQQIADYSQAMKVQGHADVVSWITEAQSVGTKMYDGNLDTAQSAKATQLFRQYAVRYAETIPGFLDFYNKNFLWQYGPLESVR